MPEERNPALDRLCLLEEPLPTAELEELLAAGGLPQPASDLDWLRAHGLLARTIAPSALAGGDAVHRLLASRRQTALAEREGELATRAWHLRIAEHLETRPGALSDFGAAARHCDAAGDREGALRLYGRWAIKLRDRYAYGACAQIARTGLSAFPVGESEVERTAAAELWGRVYDGLEPLGLVREAQEALRKALALTEGGTARRPFSRRPALVSEGAKT